jgi:hypothetical protein
VTLLTVPGKPGILCNGQGMASDHSTPRHEPPAPTTGTPADLDTDLTAVAQSLHAQYDDNLGHRTVDSEIRLVANRFDKAPIRAFVPLLVRRYAGANLRGRTRN